MTKVIMSKSNTSRSFPEISFSLHSILAEVTTKVDVMTSNPAYISWFI